MKHKRLLEVLDYNPDTGIFIRKNTGRVTGTKIRSGYLHIRIDNIAYYAHRLAWLYMTEKWPENHIDHINHDKADNRFLNLREVTQQDNARNAKLHKENKSGVTGVGWYKPYSKWRSYIAVDAQHIYLGYFDDKFEAICARKSAENKYGFHENHGRTL